MNRVRTIVTVVVLLLATAALAETGIRDTLDRAQELSRAHRYAQVITLLEPVAARKDLPDPDRFEALSEIGRAQFHLGRYREAYHTLAKALRLQPRSAEAALYFEAAAWATGRRKQALSVFETLLASGASDLYLAVTLPGARAFLADPAVWDVLERHERPLVVDVRHGIALGAPLGETKDAVLAVLPGSPPETGKGLVLHAGPKVVWAIRFGESGRFSEIVIDCQNLLRYTPYRLQFASSLDWRMTPEAARIVLGKPVSDETVADGGRVLTWKFGPFQTSMEFGSPEAPRPAVIPADSIMLRMLRMVRIPQPEGSPAPPAPVP